MISYELLDNRQCVFLTLLDLSAAFDTIDHGILLLTLKLGPGIDGAALQWLESYLSQRSQCVLIDGIQSPTQKLPYGVPQGSVLRSTPVLCVPDGTWRHHSKAQN